MLHCQRFHQGKKGGENMEAQAFLLGRPNSGYSRKKWPKLVFFLLFSLMCCSLIISLLLFTSSSTWFHLCSFGVQNEGPGTDMAVNAPPCSSVSDGTICCDRSHFRTDICIMKGDVRTHSASSSIFLYNSRNSNRFISYVSRLVDDDNEEELDELQHEKIRPYTRKWETSVMDTIDELDLILMSENVGVLHHCDVHHDVPAIVFSTGGYTGNVYHEFNDGILPLYITSQHLNKKLVFVMLEYRNWWIMKYGDILSHLSEYPAIDFTGDNRTHCFPEAIVGLRIHDELTVDSSLMTRNKSIVDFRNLLEKAYWPRIRSLIQDEERDEEEKLFLSLTSVSSLETRRKVQEDQPRRANLVILSRNGSRAITNENLLVEAAERIGFSVQVVRPERTTELAKIYQALNSSDAMVGVHGAAITHFLFMRPGTVFIQVIPLGTDWAAETYYGEPARKLGLKYIGYKILPQESSLYDSYEKNDPILRNPRSLTRRGWQYTKKIYLETQTVTLDLRRFQKRLVQAYDYYIRINQHFLHRSH